MSRARQRRRLLACFKYEERCRLLSPATVTLRATNRRLFAGIDRRPKGTRVVGVSGGHEDQAAEVLLRNSLRIEGHRAERLRVAAEVLLQMGGTAAVLTELQHDRALTHPDWATALQRRATGG